MLRRRVFLRAGSRLDGSWGLLSSGGEVDGVRVP